MKSLKLNHDHALAIVNGQKTSTWRLFDEKNVSVNDEIELIDKVAHKVQETWRVIGIAKVDSVISKRLGEVTEQDQLEHGEYRTTEEMYEKYRKFYGPEVGPNTPVKIINFTFAPYAKPKKLDAEIPKPQRVKLYSDGGSRGNPGASASGFVIMDMKDRIIVEKGVYIGITTNNQAEYHGLKLGLEEVKGLGVGEVDVYMDSMLVVNQMKGLFKVKNAEIQPVHEQVKALEKSFSYVSYTHVPRELNKLADAKVNETLDAQKP